MSLYDVLDLVCGLAMFLYGMNAMGAALEKRAGNKLKVFLGHATSNTFKGFLLGLMVTLIIQSSSATTVMVVGFVNSGIMTLSQSVGVILGANLGTSITAWILSLQAVEGGSGALVFLNLLKPSSFVPVLAIIGVILFAFQKKEKRRDVGMILLGFAILMIGMDMMSGSVSGLKNVPAFRQILIMFQNPVLGVIVGTVFTAIIQSSSASVGVLQALSATGVVSYATAVPIIMGQNIGTCVSAMISSIGTGKNARRAAVIHLSFNLIATLIILPVFYLINHLVGGLEFLNWSANYVGIAVVHTVFKLVALALIAPFSKLLVKFSCLIVRDDKKNEEAKILDERFFTVPSVAIDRAKTVTVTMAETAVTSIKDALVLLENYDEKAAEAIKDSESKVDEYEDLLGSYLVKLSSHDMTETDSAEANKLLHVIGDIERISDHAVNIVESAEEMHDKNVSFTDSAKKELAVLIQAVIDILDMSTESFKDSDFEKAYMVEPLEEVVDLLRDELKKRHILRLRNNECTIEMGFVLTDLLTNLERISDHCSNIAGCVLEIENENLDIHRYLAEVKENDGARFNKVFEEYKTKYAI